MMYDNAGDTRNYWYAATLSKQLIENKILAISIMEIPIVLWRDTNGTVGALEDRCSHRNAPLSSGKIVNNCIMCPYHGWTFNNNGDCVDIPSEGPNNQRIPKKPSVHFPVQEKHGLIWLWMGVEKTPTRNIFPLSTTNKSEMHQYFMETDFDQDVTNLIENFMDVPHTVYVHKGWFRDVKQIKLPVQVERKADSVLVNYEQSGDSIGFFNWIVNPKNLPMVHTDKFYMPNIVKVDYIFGKHEKEFIIVSTCTPISPNKTKVFTLITYNFGWVNPVAKLLLPWYTRQVINQDVKIMKLQGATIRKFGKEKFKSTQADTLHLYVESLRNYAINKYGETTPPKPISKTVEFWI